MKIFLLTYSILTLSFQAISADATKANQEIGTESQIPCSRPLAILWALIPGGGNIYCGDFKSGTMQLLGFSTALMITNYYTAQSDYLDDKNLNVHFSVKDTIVAETLRESGYLYMDKTIFNQSDPLISQYALYHFSDSNSLVNPRAPIIGETLYERDLLTCPHFQYQWIS